MARASLMPAKAHRKFKDLVSACHSRAAGAWSTSTSTSISLFRFPSKDFWPFWPPQPTSPWRSCVGSRPAQPRHPAQQAPPQAPQTPLWGWGRCRLGRRHLKRQGRCCRCRPGAHHPREETHLDHFLLPVLWCTEVWLGLGEASSLQAITHL